MPFPAPEKQESLARYLNSKYSQNYLIFNVSEHSYNPKPFLNQVVDYTFPGHPCLPLEAAFTLCKEFDSWLNSDPKHVAIVHCQSTKVHFFGEVSHEYGTKQSFKRHEVEWQQLNTCATAKENVNTLKRP